MSADSYVARFWAKVDTSAGPDGCWPWTGKSLPSGRGQLRMQRDDGSWYYAYATHVALLIDQGVVPAPGEHACHTCDNPPCVNVRHLFVSDPNGNMADAARKLRAAPNTRKLTPADVVDIHHRCEAGEGRRAVADAYGVSVSAVDQIMRGRAWKWLGLVAPAT